MDASTVAAMIAVLALLLNVLIFVRGGVWGLADRLSAIDKNLSTVLADHKRDTDENLERIRREFGETTSALRTKIHEIETWSRDEFVRKNSFEFAMNRIEKSLDRLGEKMDALQSRNSA